MFKNICLPTEGSVLATEGVRKGLALARACGASVTVVTVLMPGGFISDTGPTGSERQAADRYRSTEAKRCADAAQADAREIGVPCICVTPFNHQPYRGILEAAHTHGCDLIAMASHSRRVAGPYLGSEAQRVLAHADVPVLVFK